MRHRTTLNGRTQVQRAAIIYLCITKCHLDLGSRNDVSNLLDSDRIGNRPARTIVGQAYFQGSIHDVIRTQRFPQATLTIQVIRQLLLVDRNGTQQVIGITHRVRSVHGT